MKARSKSPGAWVTRWGFVSLEATRVVVSGVAAGAAVTHENASRALEIAIVRFFSIQIPPIRQPDCRMVQPSARGSGAAIARQTPPLDPEKRSAFSRGCGCEVNPNSGAQRHRELDADRQARGNRLPRPSGRTAKRVCAPVDSCCADRPGREGGQNAPLIQGRPRDSPVTIARAMRCARRRGSGRFDLPRVARTREAAAAGSPPAEAA